MSTTITTLELRKELAIWLADYLGTYTFKYGQQIPAIAVLPDSAHGYNYPPADEFKTTGIEARIICPVLANLGQNLQKRHTWEIYLRQWSEDAKLAPVVEALVSKLLDKGYQFTKPMPIPPREGLGITGQVRLQIYEFEVRTHA